MKKLLLHSILVSTIWLLNTTSNHAIAGIIHTFTFDEVAQWDDIRGISDGDSLSIMFDNDTDFDNVQWHDIEYFQYNLSAGVTGKIDSDFTTFGLAKTLFSEENGLVSIHLNRLGDSNYIYGYNSVTNMLGQIQSGSLSYFYLHYYPFASNGPDAAYLGLVDGLTNISYSSKVPEPSILIIFALGLMGLTTLRFKNKVECFTNVSPNFKGSDNV